MAYNTDKKPDWYVFLNMMEGLAVRSAGDVRPRCCCFASLGSAAARARRRCQCARVRENTPCVVPKI